MAAIRYRLPTISNHAARPVLVVALALAIGILAGGTDTVRGQQPHLYASPLTRPEGMPGNNGSVVVSPEQGVPAFIDPEYGGSEYGGPEYADPMTARALNASLLETPIERYRKSFYQGSEILGGYLLDTGGGSEGMHQTFEEVRVSFGLPLGSLKNILGIRPYFRFDHLNGPTTVDVPETLYNTGVSLFNQKEWTPRISSTLLLTPSVRSDFTTSDKAFRMFGLALINWKAKPELTLSLGVVYLDRADLSVLPAFGATWTPNPCWKIEATMPRPRIARRMWRHAADAEGWAYVAGTIGGNTWAVTGPADQIDELTVRDLRVLAGYEVIRAGNRGCWIEGGIAFDRSIEYERLDIDVPLDSGLFFVAGLKF